MGGKGPNQAQRAVDVEDSEDGQRVDDEQRAIDELVAKPELALLVLLRDQIQKLRIAEGNRAGAAARLEEEDRRIIHEGYEQRLRDLEDDVTASVTVEMRKHPAWPWLQKIRGVAETSAALVVGYINIEACPTVSSLWRYAGYGVVDGKRERPVKGEKLHYNARLKTMVWRLIDLQVKLRGPYRVAYDNAKHTYTTTRAQKHPKDKEGWTKGHIELASRRKAAKLFLSHLWQVWREAESLPTRSPFIIEHGGPEHDFIDPWDYIEQAKDEGEPVGAERAVAVETS